MRFGVVGMVALVVSPLVFAADPFVGTWKINIEKSKLSDPARWKGAVAIMESTGGGLRTTFERPMPDGQIRRTSNVVSYGKETPIEGSPGDTTIAERVDSFHLRIIYKTNGKQTGVLESTVSPDGKTVTDIHKGTGRSGKPLDEVRVYDKQSDSAK
jgi:hypothetical protein